MSERTYTRITIENENGTYSIEVPQTELTIDELMDHLVRSVVAAAGYHHDRIDEWLS